MGVRTLGPEFKFRKHDSIGHADAADDLEFLSECFVDTGDLEALEDCKSPQCIVLGRTGVGKSALLLRLNERQENVVRLDPESLAFTHVANSNVIQFFEECGVKLDSFYKLLWRHVLAVELLKFRYDVSSEKSAQFIKDKIKEFVKKDRAKQEAIKYIERYEDQFWNKTEYRVKGVTETIESELTGKLGASLSGVVFDASGAKKLTEEQTLEVQQKGQEVVSGVQLRELQKIIEFLAEDVFTDPMRNYYVIIDGLDENWVGEKIKYKLIRALIENLKSFRRIPPVKIILSLREDLAETVFRETRDAGFQYEKYETYFLPLKWRPTELRDLVDLRISKLVRDRYRKLPKISFNDVFSFQIDRKKALDYLISRTLLRPRDAILFVNESLARAVGQSAVSRTVLVQAEREYSKKRLRSLAEEWHNELPMLPEIWKILRGRTVSFRLSELKDPSLEEVALAVAVDDVRRVDGPLAIEAKKYVEGKHTLNDFAISVVKILYDIGVIGVKENSESPISWSYEIETSGITRGVIKRSRSLHVHPMLWAALGIISDKRAKGSSD